ncbi:hypothetical protein ACJX0J_012986, partial [Zea mays]
FMHFIEIKLINGYREDGSTKGGVAYRLVNITVDNVGTLMMNLGVSDEKIKFKNYTAPEVYIEKELAMKVDVNLFYVRSCVSVALPNPLDLFNTFKIFCMHAQPSCCYSRCQW